MEALTCADPKARVIRMSDKDPPPRFYLGAPLDDEPVDPLKVPTGLPVSPAGPPEPGTGRVFVHYAGDLDSVWGHWEDHGRYVFVSGTYGEVLRWALSQPAREHHLPSPLRNETIQVDLGRQSDDL